MRKYLILIVALAPLFFSCTTFLPEKDLEAIEFMQDDSYVLKKDIRENTGKILLRKGRRVKIIIKAAEKNIKVYAYDSDQKLLKSERYLILYLFNDDFKNEVFDKEFFLSRLYEIIKK